MGCVFGEANFVYESIRSQPETKIGTLINGFSYYLAKGSGNGISIQFVVRAGFNQEDRHQLGVSHVLEHMAFRKTKHFQNAVNFFKERGCDLNASTETDRTVYFIKIHSTDYSLLKLALDFFKDCSNNIYIDEKYIDSERKVVLEEMKMGREAFRDLDIVTSKIARNSPLAQVQSKDVYNSVSTFKSDDLKRFYRHWYKPERQALIIIGNIDVGRVEKLVDSRFRDLKQGDEGAISNIKSTELQINPPEITHAIHPITPDKRLEIYSVESNEFLSDSISRKREIVKEIINGILSDRIEIYRSHLKHANHFTATYDEIRARGGNYDLLKVRFGYKGSDYIKSLNEILLFLRQIEVYGVEQEEVDYNRRRLLAKFKAMPAEDNLSAAKRMAEYFVAEKPFPNSLPLKSDQMIRLLLSLTLDEINRELKRWLQLSNRFEIFQFTSDSVSSALLSVNQFKRSVDSVTALSIERVRYKYDKETTIADNLIDYDKFQNLRFEKPESEIYDDCLDITKIKLQNGIEIFLKPVKNDRSNKVYLQQMNSFDESLNDSSNSLLELYSHTIVGNSGIGKYSGQELKHILETNGISVSPYRSSKEFGVNAIFNTDNLELVLQVIHLYFASPKVDSAVMKSIFDVALATHGENSSNILLDTIKHFRFGQSSTGHHENWDVTGIHESDVLQYFKETFAITSGTKIVIAGSFDTATYRELLIKYLSSIPKKNPEAKHNQIEEIHVKREIGNRHIILYGGGSEQAEVRQDWSFRFQYSALNRICLSFTQDYLQLRLFERLRTKERGVYFVAVSSFYLDEQQHAGINVYYLCSPESWRRLSESVADEANILRAEGISNSVFDRIKQLRISTLSGDMLKSNFWCDYICSQIRLNRPLGDLYEEMNYLRVVKKRDVYSFIKKYIIAKNFSTYVLLPI